MTKRLLVGALLLIGTATLSAQTKSPLAGVWQVIESTGGPGTGGVTATIKNAQPGYYIFTDRHYSITRVTGDKPRMAPKDPNKPSLEDLQDANRFQAQFGTYEIKGDTITRRPSVARNSPTMNPPAPITGTFKLDGKALTLTTESATTVDPSVVKLMRVE